MQRVIPILSAGLLLGVGCWRSTAPAGDGSSEGWTTDDVTGDSDTETVAEARLGTFLWARKIGAPISAMITRADDTTIVAGRFVSVTTFGEAELHETTLAANHTENVFLAAYDSAGSLAWAKCVCYTDGAVSVLGMSGGADGSIFITGNFSRGTVETDSFTLSCGANDSRETVLAGSGTKEDMFIARFYSDGTLAWVRRVGDRCGDSGSGVSVLPDGSAVVTGVMSGHSNDLPLDCSAVIFGAGEAGETAIAPNRMQDFFVAAYDSDGSLAWVKGAGGTSGEWGTAVGVFADGGAVVTGNFGGQVGAPDPYRLVFGRGEAGETALVSEPEAAWDLFAARYRADGTLAWATGAFGPSFQKVMGLCTLPQTGQTVLVGVFDGTTVFGAGEANQTTLTPVGSEDAFIARYNGDGTLAWAKSAGGAETQDRFQDASVLSDGSSLVIGSFCPNFTITGEPSMVFGRGEPHERVFVSKGGCDIVFAKLGPDGAVQWAAHEGGSGNDTAVGIRPLSNGAVSAAGNFSSEITFGRGAPNETILTADNRSDGFLVKYAP